MTPFTSTHTVAYSETDQMGIVHHSNYLRYYETARWSLFAEAGLRYKSLEEAGYILPVVDVNIKYVRPAHYDETLLIETTIDKLAGPKICFGNKMYNADGDLVNTAEVTIAFVDNASRKPCRPPAAIAEKLRGIMQQQQANSVMNTQKRELA